MATKYEAINLAQGLPDFSTPRVIRLAAIKAIQRGYNQYSFTWGSPNLRRAISEHVKEYNGIDCSPETDVTVTCGSSEAVMASVMALSDASDEIAFFEPAYENYPPLAILSNAVPKPIPLGPDFHLDEEALKTAIGPRTRLLIVNTPHNPTGAVFRVSELKAIADACRDHNIIAVADEIYSHILYDDLRHVSLGTLDGMADRTITISGISKTYAATGWRVGFAIAASSLTNEIRKVHDYLTVCAPAPFQEAAAFALGRPRSYYTRLSNSYQRKRDFMTKQLKSIGFRFPTPEGSYYILADFSELSGLDDFQFASSMIRDSHVAAVPGSSFYIQREKGVKQIRFSYCKKDTTLHKAVERLHASLRK